MCCSLRTLVKVAAMLQKVRHEKTRTRTNERALMHAERLADTLKQDTAPTRESEDRAPGESSPCSSDKNDAVSTTAGQRLRYAYTVWFPLKVMK
jgi:hypothetical protein